MASNWPPVRAYLWVLRSWLMNHWYPFSTIVIELLLFVTRPVSRQVSQQEYCRSAYMSGQNACPNELVASCICIFNFQALPSSEIVILWTNEKKKCKVDDQTYPRHKCWQPARRRQVHHSDAGSSSRCSEMGPSYSTAQLWHKGNTTYLIAFPSILPLLVWTFSAAALNLLRPHGASFLPQWKSTSQIRRWKECITNCIVMAGCM